MKLTTAAVLTFACASTLASSVSYDEAAIYARDLYEREIGEGVLESFEKRRGGGRGPSLSRSFANAAGNLGGRVASNAAQLAIQQKIAPNQQQRRSFMRRRRLAPGSFGPVRKTGKGMATSFFNGFSQGVAARGFDEDILDELD